MTSAADRFRWDTELLNAKDIISDPITCAWSICAPSVLFGRNVNRVTDGRTPFGKAALNHLARGGCYCWCCCLPYYTAPFRAQLRQKRNLPMDPYSDMNVHRWCHPCALCQEERELTVSGRTTTVGPKKATVDRSEEETRKHLEDVQPQIMEK